MTYTLTPEQAAALADVPPGVTAYLAVKGQPCFHLVAHTPHPPADLAALVEQRCETCNGSRLQKWQPGELPGGGYCPKCHDGKPLHTIQHGDHPSPPTLAMELSGEAPCSRCFTPLPGRWTYDALLPVKERDDRSKTPLVFVNEVGHAYLYDPAERINIWIDVDGTPEPGHFVLAATRRTP